MIDLLILQAEYFIRIKEKKDVFHLIVNIDERNLNSDIITFLSMI